MKLLIDNRTEEPADYADIIEAVLKTGLKSEGFGEDVEISLSFVTNDEIRDINKEFRKIDAATDVLSFPQIDFGKNEPIGKNEDGEAILGDIIISLEKAKEQAFVYGHSIEREIAFLSVHSLLHLLGYDHISEKEELAMRQKQKKILEEAGFLR
ncbi:MAG: rRNA maturation RNase YbeY [Lachnospiraceae bacterium]|nr:rRNA maturation RNase YbeY [Lachnospiraceae bacterium]